MKYYVEKDLADFEAWSGGKVTLNELTQSECELVEQFMEESAGEDGLSETEINDILWFERDTIAEWLGYENWDDLERKHRGEEDDEEEDDEEEG